MEYVGTELELFAQAENWKAYIALFLKRYIHGRVLEVGAGIGANIERLAHENVMDWLALEPDPRLAAEIGRRLLNGKLPRNCRVVVGTLDDLQDRERFDSILYIDVLEHIAEDQAEVVKASRLLAPGGHLVILAPAHHFLYSPFDKSIGHFRRYNIAGLRALTPSTCHVVRTFMLDSIGFFISLANRFILRSASPTRAQIMAWDRCIVPLSRVIDPLTGFRFGKSVIVVWQAVI